MVRSLPCLLFAAAAAVMKPIFAGSVFGWWVTAIGAVLVMVVIVAAGIIKVDIIKTFSPSAIHKVTLTLLCSTLINGDQVKGVGFTSETVTAWFNGF